MNRASFRTKSMSLNVSGKHNNKCKSMLCTEFFSLSHASHVARMNNPYFVLKRKVQWKVHFVESMVFFSLVRLILNLFSFQAIYSAFMLLQHHTQHTPMPPFLRMQKQRPKQHAVLKISKPTAVTNHLMYHHFSSVVACASISFYFKFSYSAFIHSVWF